MQESLLKFDEKMDAFTQRFSDLEEEVLHSKREPEETEGLKEDVQKQQNAIKSNVSWLEFELLLEKLRSEVFLVAVQRAQAAFCNARLSSVGIDSWLGWIPILVFMKTIDFSCALDVFFWDLPNFQPGHWPGEISSDPDGGLGAGSG